MYRLAVILAAEARADGSAGTRTPAPGRPGLIGPGPRGGRAPCDWCAGFGARSGARQPDPAHVSTVGHAMTCLLVLSCRAKPAGRPADPADVSHLPHRPRQHLRKSWIGPVSAGLACTSS